MTAHLKQDQPDTSNRLDHMKQGVLGKPVSRVEGLAKVTGTAPYAAEYPVENCAEGVLVTSTITRGEVLSINRDAVLAMPGVIAVIDDERFDECVGLDARAGFLDRLDQAAHELAAGLDALTTGISARLSTRYWRRS